MATPTFVDAHGKEHTLVCNGGACDQPRACEKAVRCLYRSSADEARESFGKCPKGSCNLCVPGIPRTTTETAVPSSDTNPKDLQGMKKVNLFVVPPASIIYEALAMQDGAVKYGPFNWRQKKVIASIYIAAAMRHLFRFLDGEEIDPESGKPHLGHAKACLGIIIDAKETGNLIDDRPTPGSAASILDRYHQVKT